MKITVGQVKTALDEVAATDTDRVDARVERRLAPRYVEHGTPCCLVAVILHRLGFTIAQLRQLDNEHGTSGGGVIFAESQHPLLKRINPDARVLLSYLQRRQDTGRDTWAQIADRALQRGGFAITDQNRHVLGVDRVAGQWANRPFPWNENPDPTENLRT